MIWYYLKSFGSRNIYSSKTFFRKLHYVSMKAFTARVNSGTSFVFAPCHIENNIKYRHFTHNCMELLRESCNRTDLIVWKFRLWAASQFELSRFPYHHSTSVLRHSALLWFLRLSSFSQTFLKKPHTILDETLSFNIILNMTGPNSEAIHTTTAYW